MFYSNVQTTPVEIEVFRITPLPERLYETASYTRKTGSYPNEQYFTTETPRFLGKFIKHCQIGFGEAAIHYDIFEKDGHKVRVDYAHNGTTCYREYDPLTQPSQMNDFFAINPEISNTKPVDPKLFNLKHNDSASCCSIS